MATRANIVVQTGPKTFKVIYTHSDGYPSWMGVYLDRFHNTLAAAKAIVELGDMSALDARLAPDEGEQHGFDYRSSAAFCSVFFGRDRDPGSYKARTYRTLEAALEACGHYAVYVWVRGSVGWTFALLHGDEVEPDDLQDLAAFVRQDEDCIARIAELDAEGQTVEWRDAGCPHERTEGDGFVRWTPKPIGWVSPSIMRAQRYQDEALF